MDEQDLKRIEAHLTLTIPSDYFAFALDLPRDADVTIWEGTKKVRYAELWSTADRVIVENLTLRQAGSHFAEQRWPERYFALGGDGCGNLYSIDTAKDTNLKVFFFDHEANSFYSIAPTFKRFLAGLVMTTQLETSNENDGSLTVSRAPVPWKSLLQPISLQEWIEYIQHDPEIELQGFRELVNPFTKQVTRLDQPGNAIWKHGKATTVIEYQAGRVIMEGTDARKLKKMRQIADALRGRVFSNGREAT